MNTNLLELDMIQYVNVDIKENIYPPNVDICWLLIKYLPHFETQFLNIPLVKRNFFKHVKIVHTKREKNLLCDQCDKKFEHSYQLKAHKLGVHEG